MGGRGSKSGIPRASAVLAGQTQQAAPVSYDQLTRQEGQQLLQDMLNGYDINTKLAVNQYIRADTMSNGYSMSQNLNHKLENDHALNANEQYVANKLDAAMQPLGKDTTLVRAAHKDFLEAMGVKNYQSMSESQINSQLKGVTYQEKKFVSTAYNAQMNPFIGGSQSGGREVFINIKAPASTKVVAGNTRQAEVILSRGVKYQVESVHFDGTYAYPRTGGRLPRLIVDVKITD